MISAIGSIEGWRDKRDEALWALGLMLRTANYRFTTITPESHRRVTGRGAATLDPLVRVFGWSLPFAEGDLPDPMLKFLDIAQALEGEGGALRSTVRFSSLGDQLFVHSAFPTEAADCVFFGPDTYRFARALKPALEGMPTPPAVIADIGCGSGAGGLHAAALAGATRETVILSDINSLALRYAHINARLNGVRGVRVVKSDLFDRIDEADLIISNPPYLADSGKRLYRDGGGEFGLDLSRRIVEEGLSRLRPGGRLFLYTGVAIVAGEDPLLGFLKTMPSLVERRWSYDEIDPDVFGEELSGPPYDRADRIAAVALTIDLERN